MSASGELRSVTIWFENDGYVYGAVILSYLLTSATTSRLAFCITKLI
jgi:hypothetical protein